MQDLTQLIKFQGNKFVVEFSGKSVPDTESEPWPKTIQSVTLTNCCPSMSDTQTIMESSFEKQGCSQMAKHIRRKLWIEVVRHIINVFGIQPDEIFKE